MVNLAKLSIVLEGGERNPKLIHRTQGLEFQLKPDVLIVIVFNGLQQSNLKTHVFNVAQRM